MLILWESYLVLPLLQSMKQSLLYRRLLFILLKEALDMAALQIGRQEFSHYQRQQECAPSVHLDRPSTSIIDDMKGVTETQKCSRSAAHGLAECLFRLS